MISRFSWLDLGIFIKLPIDSCSDFLISAEISHHLKVISLIWFNQLLLTFLQLQKNCLITSFSLNLFTLCSYFIFFFKILSLLNCSLIFRMLSMKLCFFFSLNFQLIEFSVYIPLTFNCPRLILCGNSDPFSLIVIMATIPLTLAPQISSFSQPYFISWELPESSFCCLVYF